MHTDIKYRDNGINLIVSFPLPIVSYPVILKIMFPFSRALKEPGATRRRGRNCTSSF